MESKSIDVFATLKKYILVDGYDAIVDLEKSNGYYLHDSKHNKDYLDFFSFFASAPIGFNHPAMLEDEHFLKNLKLASIHKVSNSDFYTTQYAEFVEMLAKVAMPEEFIHSFFISGGALAVENSMKAAFDWKVRQNMSRGIEGEVGSQMMHFKEAFHGRSGYTMSLTNTADPRKYMYYPKFDWPRITNPKIIFPEKDNIETIKASEEKSLQEINSSFDKYPNDIAGIMIEPIQGEGGDNHFRPEYLRELRKVADEREAMLIFDEVQTGVGITGKMWAYQHYPGVVPDLLIFGKKMQVCGFMSTKRIDEVENNVFQESSRINSTWGANLVDMVRATKFLEIIHNDDLVGNAERMGNYILNKMFDLQNDYSDILTNLRGRGLFIAFDFPTPEIRQKVQDMMYEENVLILACGHTSLRLRPPLIIDKEAIEIFLQKFESVLKKLK